MTFEQCLNIVLEHEGGYIHHESDPGGETNFGISKRYYPNLDMKNLTVSQAAQIYKMDYWDKSMCEMLPFTIRLLFFDACVNQGIPRATMLMQRSCGLSGDGVLGPISLNAIREMPTKDLIYRFSMARLDAYTKNPNWPTFGKGWVKRLNDVTIRSLVFLL